MDTQSRPPGYELFFAPLEVVLNPHDHERVRFAYFASKFGHALQVRADGTRYFDHLKGAAWIYISEFGGRDPELIIAILLHDLSEDSCLLSPYRIGLNFGEECALDVRALTKLSKNKRGEAKETTEEYLSRIIARGPRTIVAKLCDRLHNLRSLRAVSEERRRKNIDETKEFYIPILLPALSSVSPDTAKKMNILLEEAMKQY